LITEELPVAAASLRLATSDDDGASDSDPDPDALSSVDGERSDDDASSSDEAKQAAARQKRRETVKSMRQKLDGMLFYFFEHLEECMGAKMARPPAAETAEQNTTNSGGSTPSLETSALILPSLIPRRQSPTPAQSLSHVQTLLTLFSRQILSTSATQHIPFLLFLCASFSTTFTDLFLGLLVSQALYATNTTSPTATTQRISLSQRVAATVYIGSIVCRARFVTDEQARQVTTYLLAYIDGKLQQTRTARSVDELPLFYAVCQAVMLIFCFRWRAFSSEREGDSVLGEMEMDSDSIEDAAGSKWMRDLEILQRAVTSELNPLLVGPTWFFRSSAVV
jgi:RNA polymerase I-specific transcription initiation factor RRN3